MLYDVIFSMSCNTENITHAFNAWPYTVDSQYIAVQYNVLLHTMRPEQGLCCINQIWNSQTTPILFGYDPMASIHRAIRRLIVRSREVSKSRDWILESSYCSAI